MAEVSIAPAHQNSAWTILRNWAERGIGVGSGFVRETGRYLPCRRKAASALENPI